MLSIILADDEQLDLDYMSRVVDYKSLGLNVIAICRNGSELFQKVAELKPDIIITDIVMPGISGIELSERLKECSSNVKIVFVSGHQNFSYAQKAIESGVRGYIVKPILPEKLEQILAEIVEECIEENRIKYERELFSFQLNENMPLLKELFSKQLASGMLDFTNIEERLAFYDIYIKPEFLQAVTLVPYCERSDDINNSEYSEKLNLLSLKNSTEVFLGSKNISFCSIIDSDILTFIINSPVNDKTMSFLDIKNISHTMALELQQSVMTDSGISVTVGLGTVVNGYENIHRSVTQARRALDMRTFLGKDNVIAFDDMSDSRELLLSGLEQMGKLIREAVNLGDCEKIDEIFNDFCNKIDNTFSIERIKLFAAELLSICVSDQMETWGNHSDDARLTLEYSKFFSAVTFNELLGHLKQVMLYIAGENNRHMNDRGSQIVSMIDDIIKKRYAEELSVESIASKIYISPSYASRIYKKLTGQNIIANLTVVRMKKAVELLKNPEYKINEVANLTGYSNISYFSAVFRKYFGSTPTRYREIYASSESDSHSETDKGM